MTDNDAIHFHRADRVDLSFTASSVGRSDPSQVQSSYMVALHCVRITEFPLEVAVTKGKGTAK